MKKILLISALSLGFGCGGGLDDNESSQAFAATQIALSQGAGQAKSTGPADSLTIDYAYTCLGGGNAKFNGTVDDKEGSEGGSFQYQVSFDGCVSNGITIDGDMNYRYDIEKSGDDLSFTYSFKGDLEYSGEVNGGCIMDVNAAVNITSGKTPGKGNISYKYSGSVCGNDASGSLNTSFGG